jgi:hypothetical protein
MGFKGAPVFGRRLSTTGGHGIMGERRFSIFGGQTKRKAKHRGVDVVTITIYKYELTEVVLERISSRGRESFINGQKRTMCAPPSLRLNTIPHDEDGATRQ